jgi:hypothetical protein
MRLARLVGATALIGAIAGWALLGGGAMPEHGPPTVEAQQVTDTRQRVALTSAERDAVLAEMRLMLGSVSGVLQGLAADDRAAVEKAARASGMVMAVDPRLKQKLPRQFLEMGMATHRKFDQLADAAKGGAPSDQALRSLADLTTHCVACHAMYRF